MQELDQEKNLEKINMRPELNDTDTFKNRSKSFITKNNYKSNGMMNRSASSFNTNTPKMIKN